ncbi:hypothetical protein [uncultured Thiodictyon sp.]|nr:hypothetical protein [uncultured Thiodictyon sp.]
MDQQPDAFSGRMARLSDAHAKKPALIRRFREAKLIDRPPC